MCGRLCPQKYGILVLDSFKNEKSDGIAMVCIHDDGNGWCTGRYEGFGCIQGVCEDYSSKESDSGFCSGIVGGGTYCFKYNRFYCAGKENCANENYYTKMLKVGVR